MMHQFNKTIDYLESTLISEVNALNLKDNLILKYKLDKNEREILNTVFSEVEDELLDLIRH